MPMPEITASDILLGLVGTGGLGLSIRAFITWAGRQGLISTGDNSQKGLIEDLRTEAKKWQERYDGVVKDHDDSKRQHESTLILLGEVRNQNKMLRMLLIQRGMSADELDAALEISEPTLPGERK